MTDKNLGLNPDKDSFPKDRVHKIHELKPTLDDLTDSELCERLKKLEALNQRLLS